VVIPGPTLRTPGDGAQVAGVAIWRALALATRAQARPPARGLGTRTPLGARAETRNGLCLAYGADPAVKVGSRSVKASSGAAAGAPVAAGLVGGWLVVRHPTLAIALIAGLGLALLPPTLFLAAGVVTSAAELQTPILRTSLFATDLLLLGWFARSLLAHGGGLLGLWPVWIPLGVFIGWAFVATYENAAPLTPLMRVLLYVGLMLSLARHAINERLLYAVVLGVAVWNILVGVSEGQSRLVGMFIGDPAQMGALILAAAAPLLAGDLRFPGWWLTIPVLGYGLWLTQTRSVWFATVLMVLVWAFRKRLGRKRTIALIVAVAVTGFQVVGVVTDRLHLNTSSGVMRLESISNGLESGLRHPWFGTGWATVDAVSVVGVNPYNLFVNVFASVGLPALIGLCAFLFALLGRLARSRRAPFLFVVAFLGMSLTEMSIFAGSMLTVLFFVFAGVGLNSGRLEELRRERTETGGVGRGDGAPSSVNRRVHDDLAAVSST
jgi:hypothetical protein